MSKCTCLGADSMVCACRTSKLISENARLRKQVERMREALEVYAHPIMLQVNWHNKEEGPFMVDLNFDHGEKAKKALSEIDRGSK